MADEPLAALKMPSDNRLSVRLAHRLSSSFVLETAFDASSGFTMILGPSGGGKTTLLNCIAGFMRPDSGRVALGARVLFDSDERIDMPVAERRLGYVFQNLALFPHLTVAQNVQYGIAKLPAKTRLAQMITMLESFRIAQLIARKPSEISGGERQRVALARSLVTNRPADRARQCDQIQNPRRPARLERLARHSNPLRNSFPRRSLRPRSASGSAGRRSHPGPRHAAARADNAASRNDRASSGFRKCLRCNG